MIMRMLVILIHSGLKLMSTAVCMHTRKGSWQKLWRAYRSSEQRIRQVQEPNMNKLLTDSLTLQATVRHSLPFRTRKLPSCHFAAMHTTTPYMRIHDRTVLPTYPCHMLQQATFCTCPWVSELPTEASFVKTAAQTTSTCSSH